MLNADELLAAWQANERKKGSTGAEGATQVNRPAEPVSTNFGGAPEVESLGLDTDASGTAGRISSSTTYADHVHLNARQGHGFAAEKVNHLHDQLAGKDALLVGGDNAKNGADRIVDGIRIQTKYCATPEASMRACFGADGKFRYLADGRPMQIEVPPEQREAAIAILENEIRKNNVPGVSPTSTDAAKEIVREGHYTYAQAKNIQRFGTLESLTYDAVNGLQIAGTAMGISAALTFAVSILNGKDWKDALDQACYQGLSVGGVAWVGNLLTAQLGRTGLEQALRGGTDWIVKQMGSKASAYISNAIRSGGKDLSGAAAKSYLSKVLRGNAVTGLVSTLVLSTDDFLSLFDGKASGAQVFKNVAKTATGVASGTAGWMSGAAAGAAVGSALPIIGTAAGGIIGGLIGSAAAGGTASTVASKLLDSCIEDDATQMYRIIRSAFAQLAEDYLLTESEAKVVLKEFQDFDLQRLLPEMYASENRERFARQLLRPLVEERAEARPCVKLPTDEDVIAATRALIERICEGSLEQEPRSDAQQSADQRGDPQTESRPSQAVLAESPIRKTKELFDFLYEYHTHLNDGSSVYFGGGLATEKAQKKIQSAVESYAYYDKTYKTSPLGSLILLVDTTVWGSAKDGLYITEDEIYIKPSYEDRKVIKIKDITHIRVDESDRELCVNGKYYSYTQSSVTPQMKIVVKCIRKYLEQFAPATSS